MASIIKFLRSPSDDAEQKAVKEARAFKENWGILMVVVGMYSGKYLPMANVFWVWIHIPFLIFTAYYALAIEYDFGLFSATVHYVLMMISVASSIVNSQLHRGNLESIIWTMEKGFFKYDDTLDPETEEEIHKDLEVMRKRKRIFSSILFMVFMMGALVSMTVFPFIFYNSERVMNDPFMHWDMPVVTWYPLGTSWLNWLWILFIEYWIAYVIIVVLAGTDVPYLCFCEEGIHELKTIGLTFRFIIRRAKYCYKKRFGEEFTSLEDPKFLECVRICLNKSIEHHQIIIQFFENLRRLFFFILLIIMLGSTFLLCISGILFVSDDVEMKSKLQFVSYLIVVVLHIFTFCCYGEYVSDLSLSIRDQLYNAEWERCSGTMKKYILIMQAYMNQPIIITAGGFMACNLKTFGNVLSSSYSYFNLLSVMMTRDEKSQA